MGSQKTQLTDGMDFEEYTPRLDPVWRNSRLFPEMRELQDFSRKPKIRKQPHRSASHDPSIKLDVLGRKIGYTKLSPLAEEVLSVLTNNSLKQHELFHIMSDKVPSRIKSALQSLITRDLVRKTGIPRRGKDMTTGLIYERVI